MEIYKTPIGVLVMDGEKVIDKILFPKDSKIIAKRLSGDCPEEIKLKGRYPKARLGEKRLPLADLAEKTGFCKRADLGLIISAVNSELAKSGVSKGFGKDKLIVNAVRAQRALEGDINTQCETLREWYSIHFPELNELLKENLAYASVVANVGQRAAMDESSLSKNLEDRRYAKAIPPIAKESIGSPVADADMQVMMSYASAILGMAKEDATLKGYIEKSMIEIAPNTSIVATPYVGALLIEQAGSLERLAALPASTVQILGAQKAMFRFLKTKTLPPKHGVLYVHPLVSQAPKKNKGKMARTLASKISIAAKVDFYGGAPIGEKLKKGMEKRAASLKEVKGVKEAKGPKEARKP